MEIKCTEREKEILINAVISANACTKLFRGFLGGSDNICQDLMNKNIKWDIVEDTIKPCPVCGEYADVERNVFRWYISCPHCGKTSDEFDTKDEAIKAWNERS